MTTDACTICGQPKHRHVEICGVGLVCPVQAVTYRAPGPKLPLLSHGDAQLGGHAIHDHWAKLAADDEMHIMPEPPFSRVDCAWPDLFRNGYEAVRTQTEGGTDGKA